MVRTQQGSPDADEFISEMLEEHGDQIVVDDPELHQFAAVVRAPVKHRYPTTARAVFSDLIDAARELYKEKVDGALAENPGALAFFEASLEEHVDLVEFDGGAGFESVREFWMAVDGDCRRSGIPALSGGIPSMFNQQFRDFVDLTREKLRESGEEDPYEALRAYAEEHRDLIDLEDYSHDEFFSAVTRAMRSKFGRDLTHGECKVLNWICDEYVDELDDARHQVATR